MNFQFEDPPQTQPNTPLKTYDDIKQYLSTTPCNLSNLESFVIPEQREYCRILELLINGTNIIVFNNVDFSLLSPNQQPIITKL